MFKKLHAELTGKYFTTTNLRTLLHLQITDFNVTGRKIQDKALLVLVTEFTTAFTSEIEIAIAVSYPTR